MKCEHCGKNEVTFVYQSNINGKVTEKHLCGECAGELGFTQRLAAQNQRMMKNLGSMFGGGFFEDFFSPVPSLFGRMSALVEDPFDDFFANMPALGTSSARQSETQEKKELVDQAEQKYFSRQRQLNALRLEMKEAVRQEKFERAAELRDQVRALEAEQEEPQENQEQTENE